MHYFVTIVTSQNANNFLSGAIASDSGLVSKHKAVFLVNLLSIE